MADQVNPQAANQTAAAMQGLENATRDVGKATSQVADGITKEFGNTAKSVQNSTKMLQRFGHMATSVMRSMMPVTREVKTFSKITTDAGKNITDLGKSMHGVTMKGQKDLMGLTNNMKKYYEALKIATVEAKDASEELEKTSKNYAQLAKDAKFWNDEEIRLEKTLKTAITQRDALNKKLEAGIALTKEEKETLIKSTDAITETGPALIDARIWQEAYRLELQSTRIALQTVTDNYVGARDALTEKTKATLESIKRDREALRETQKLRGGTEAMKGALQGLADKHIWEWVNYLSSGAAIVEGLKMIDKSLTKTSNYMTQVQDLELQMGSTGKKSASDLAKDYAAANTSLRNMSATAAELYMDLDEVKGIADKIRFGIRVDREGKLTEAAVAGMTREVAVFSKVTGVDAGTAVDMLDKRMKNYNMTALEAQADMAGLRSMMSQMAVGTRGSVIAMDDMVKAINEASDASNSYIVDVRLLAQAQRAASNQAADMGANQKLAKDVMKTVGKMAGDLPSFIQIPTGKALWDQLTGPNAEKNIAKLDSQTQKLVRHIIDVGKKGGAAGQYQAQRMLMENIKGTELGMDAVYEQYENLRKQGSVVTPLLLKQWGLAESDTAAQSMLETLDKAAKKKEELAKLCMKDVSMTELMDDKYERLNKALDTAVTHKDKLARVTSMGIDKSLAEDYLKKMNISNDKIRKLKKQKDQAVTDEQKRDAEKQIQEEQLLMGEALRKGTDPLAKATANLQKVMDETGAKGIKVDSTYKVDMTDLQTQLGVKDKSDDARADAIMKAFGLTNDVQRKAVLEDIAGGKDINAKHISDLQKLGEQTAKDQEEALSSENRALKDGIVNGMGKLFDKYFTKGFFATGHGELTKAVALVSAGLLGALYLMPKVMKYFETATKLGTMAGVRAALGRGGGLPGSEDESGGDVGGGGALKKLGNLGKGIKGKWGKLGRGGKAGVIGVGIAATAAIAYGLYHMFKKKDEKEEEKKEGSSGAPSEGAPPEGGGGGGGIGQTAMSMGGMVVGGITAAKLGKSAIGMAGKGMTMLKGGSKVAEGAADVAKVAGKSGMFAKLGLKGLKLGRAIPMLGTVVGAGFAAMQAWDIYKKWKAGEKITPSDKIKMVTELASMIPGIGGFVAAGDAAMELSGGYDKIDEAASKDAQALAASSGGSAPPAVNLPQGDTLSPEAVQNQPGAAAAFNKPSLGGVQASARSNAGGVTGGGDASMEMVPGSIGSDGTVTVKLRGFVQAMSSANKMMDAAKAKS